MNLHHRFQVQKSVQLFIFLIITLVMISHGLKVLATTAPSSAASGSKLVSLKISLPPKIEVGDEVKVEVTSKMKPETAAIPEIKYSIDNSSIATIDQDGTVYAVSTGRVHIKAKASGITATAAIDIQLSASAEEPRIVINGNVHKIKSYLIKGEYFIKPQELENVLKDSSKPFKMAELADKLHSVMIDNVRYVKISDIAKLMNFSCTNDTVLKAEYIWTDENYGGEADKDFSRAIGLGLVPDNLKGDGSRQITSTEFRSLLVSLIQKMEPDKAEWFQQQVTTFSKPLLRGEGFVMAYYAAACVGADTHNNSFDNRKADGNDFWDGNGYDFDPLFPHIWDGPVKFSTDNNSWHNYYTAAFLWSFWHSSPISGGQVFEYDEAAGSMRQKEPLKVGEAVDAAVRIYDSYTAPVQYNALTDESVVNYDPTIITDALLNKANALPAVTSKNMPVWKGFVLSNGGSYENTDIVESQNDLRNIANWGFNSIRLMLTYRTLFDENVKTANVGNFKKLDTLIAAAIRYHLHMDLLTFSLPGRWTSYDTTTFKTVASLDLFTNPDRQREANTLWAVLAERYKNIPSSVLSFCPIWEAQNTSLSSGLDVTPYTVDDVANVYSQLIDTIRKASSNRLILFEPTPNNSADSILTESKKIKDTIEGKYTNVVMMSNFCEMPFVYAEMTAVAGEHIDHNNHSMFKPAYPTTIYATQYHFDHGSALNMNGALVAGTKLDLYLSKVNGNGEFQIVADGKTIYNEAMTTTSFHVDTPLSGYYPYAQSDKHISITLPSDVKDLQISYSGNWFEWSGMEVTLPDNYSVKRWWFPSMYDAAKNGTEQSSPELKDTSTIMISPYNYNTGGTITINPDITYKTSEIRAQSNQQTIEAWAKMMHEYSPNLVVRFENAGFSVGCIHDSALKYYDDLLTAFDKYGISWYSNDYFLLLRGPVFYAGITTVPYNGMSLDIDMLKLFQSHQ